MRVEGVQALLRRLKEFGEDGEHRIDQVTHTIAQKIVEDAKSKVPVNFGTLKNTIHWVRDEDGTYWVKANAFYAAYVEFGTGTFVEVASEWKDIAWSYYVNGKGFMHPSPYLYPAFVAGREVYETQLKGAINNLVSRFNNEN